VWNEPSPEAMKATNIERPSCRGDRARKIIGSRLGMSRDPAERTHGRKLRL
jgi:hypothetical protein